MKRKKVLVVALSTIFLVVVGYFWYKESDIRADIAVTDTPLIETFNTTNNNQAVDTKDIKAAVASVSTINNPDAINGNNVLKISETSYDKPKVEYYQTKLIGLAKEGNYDVYLAVKGKIEGDSATLKIQWKNKILYPRPINSASSVQRIIKPGEIDENNWTIIHYSFTLPAYVDRNDVTISFGGYNGNKFSGLIDSLSVQKAAKTKADFGVSSDVLNWITTTLPLNTLVTKPLSGLLVSGKGTIISPESFIRISLVDKDGKNYQVYENNSALNKLGDFTIAASADETKALIGVVPAKIEILTDQSIIWQIDSIRLITKEDNLAPVLKIDVNQAMAENSTDKSKAKNAVINDIKPEADNQKLAKMKDWAKEQNLNDLQLGETDISKMTFEEKKKFFGGNVPNLRGFEYYQSGVFKLEGTSADQQEQDKSAAEKTKQDQEVLKAEIGKNKDQIEKTLKDIEAQAKDSPELQKNLLEINSASQSKNTNANGNMPISLNINKAKAANLTDQIKIALFGPAYPNTYDWRIAQGRKDYTTPVRVGGQGSCGSCYAWSTTAAIESKIKIKYNIPSRDFDLSEQMAMIPMGIAGCFGGYTFFVLDYVKTNGIGYEADVPYQGKVQIGGRLPNPNRKWKIKSYDMLENYYNWGRNVTPKDNEVKTMIYNVGPAAMCVKDWNHCMLAVGYYWYNGQTAYIFKNSWGKFTGTLWGIPNYDGYVYAIVPDSQKNRIVAPIDPFPYPASGNDNMPVPNCQDKDQDGFVYCPAVSGPYPLKDCDDSNASYPKNGCPGPY